jgi:hypothetical protein
MMDPKIEINPNEPEGGLQGSDINVTLKDYRDEELLKVYRSIEMPTMKPHTLKMPWEPFCKLCEYAGQKPEDTNYSVEVDEDGNQTGWVLCGGGIDQEADRIKQSNAAWDWWKRKLV